MSVCVVMVPVVLTMRVVMGKERFEAMISGLEIIHETICTDKNQLIGVVRRARYDINEFGDLLKTHFGKDNYFFWELRNGKWCAVFSKGDSSASIAELISRVNKASNKNFFADKNVEKTENQEKEVPYRQFPTIFTDYNLLVKTLESLGLTVTAVDEVISCELDGCKMKFFKMTEEHFFVRIYNTKELEKGIKQLSGLNDEYQKNAQDFTYNKIIDQISKRADIKLVNEYVEEDDTIILTLEVK